MRSSFQDRCLRGAQRLLVVIGSCVLVAGCSSSTDSTPAGSSGSSGAVSGSGKCADGTSGDFCGHIKITGAYLRDLDFHASSAFAGSCASWLKGKRDDPTLLLLPSQSTGTVAMDAVVQNYMGPGAYGIDDLVGDLGGFQIVVDQDGFRSSEPGHPPATGGVTINPDGSGTLTVVGLQPVGDSNKVQQPIDAVVTWKCVMAP